MSNVTMDYLLGDLVQHIRRSVKDVDGMKLGYEDMMGTLYVVVNDDEGQNLFATPGFECTEDSCTLPIQGDIVDENGFDFGGYIATENPEWTGDLKTDTTIWTNYVRKHVANLTG